jgi:hypothetical protein
MHPYFDYLDEMDLNQLLELARSAPYQFLDPDLNLLTTLNLECGICSQPIFDDLKNIHRCSLVTTIIKTDDGQCLFETGD